MGVFVRHLLLALALLAAPLLPALGGSQGSEMGSVCERSNMSCCPVGACDCALESSEQSPDDVLPTAKTWESTGKREWPPVGKVIGMLPADPGHGEVRISGKRAERAQLSRGSGRSPQQSLCSWQL